MRNLYYKFPLYFFLILFFIFVLSSSVDIYGGRVKEGIFPNIYYIKHLIVFLTGFLGFIHILKCKRINIIFVMILSLFLLCLTYNIFIFFQVLFLLLGSYFFSFMFPLIPYHIRKLAIILFLMLLVVPILNILLSNGDFIYNNFYGRYRLLLGYFHPKEEGILFLIVFLIILLFYNIRYRLIFHAFALILLFFIQSRNAFLFYFNFLFFSFIHRKFGSKVMILIFILFYVLIPLFFIFNYYYKINFLLSNRLDVWSHKLYISILGKNFSFSNEISKFHADNFYIEYITNNGIFLFSLFIMFLIFIGMKLKNIYLNGRYSVLSLYVSFLIFCFFDSGMFSTGNLLHIFIWSLIFFILRNKRCLKYEYNL